MTKILADYPAYTIIEGKDHEFVDGEEFGIAFKSARYGDLYHFFQIGSVEGYAKKRGDDPVARVERAKSLGHELYYAFGLGVVLHNGPKVKTTKLGLAFGDVISFEGKKFRLDPAPNQNVKLTEV